MSEREQVYQLLDTVPSYNLKYVIAYLQGLTETDADEPNAETIAAMEEGDEMLKNGTGQRFEGSTEDFFKMLLEE